MRPRVRPSRELFAELCAKHTRREIAAAFGVTVGAVCIWERHYDLRALPGKKSPGRPPKDIARKRQVFNKRAVERGEPKPGAFIPLKARIRNTVIGPRTGITAPSDRRQRDEHRDQLAHDVERYLAQGGEIETLPGPGNQPTRRVMHTGIMGL